MTNLIGDYDFNIKIKHFEEMCTEQGYTVNYNQFSNEVIVYYNSHEVSYPGNYFMVNYNVTLIKDLILSFKILSTWGEL